MQPIFITGIGTNVGKTVIAAIIAEALQADYWKPVQAGYKNGSDTEWMKTVLVNSVSKIHAETYKLKLAASPHIAAREEEISIDPDEIARHLMKIQDIMNKTLVTGDHQPSTINRQLIIEGAGGLLVPLNEKEFVIDLVKKLDGKVILVSRNYLGSINHSLLTAATCKQQELKVAGWIFNDQYLDYEDEIVRWTGIPKIASIPFSENPGKEFIQEQAEAIRSSLQGLL